jgi:hypothetical protein
MRRFTLLLSLMSLPSAASMNSASQNDWSGGPGVWGPVTSFGDEFYSDAGIEYGSASGGLLLDLIDQVVGHQVVTSYDGASCARGADIDLDGDMDIVGCAWYDDVVSWFENLDGEGKDWKEHIVSSANFPNAESVCPADIDGDGYTDIVACSAYGGSEVKGVVWYRNPAGSGSQWVKHTIEYNPAFQVYSEDIDGDGDMDVVRAAPTLSGVPPGLVWWENLDGEGTSWTEHVIDGVVYARCAYSEDIDGDGDMDAVSANFSLLSWWENLDGKGTTWTEHIVDDYFKDVNGVYSEDVDGDGDMDIIGAAYGSGISDEMSWWENVDGSGASWVQHVVDGDFASAYSVDAADMDEDGDIDIIGASEWESEISWWENLNGSGTSWRKHLINGGFGMAHSVCAEDVDGDGMLDIIGAAWSGDKIAWWDVLTYAPEGWLISSVLDVSCWPDWGTLDWTADVPAGTTLGLQVRSSSNPDSSSMGPWSDILYAPCSLHGILPHGEQYFQYKAILKRLAQEATPDLQSVTVTWEPMVGLDEHDASILSRLFPISPNPVIGVLTIDFAVPAPSSVMLSVYDISGRLVCNAGPAGYEPGTSSVQFGELDPGIYFVRMRTGEFEAIQRFAVVE